MHPSRTRTFDGKRREKSLGASDFDEEISQIGSLHAMGRIRMERTRLFFRGRSSRKFAVLLSRSPNHGEQYTGRRIVYTYIKDKFTRF